MSYMPPSEAIQLMSIFSICYIFACNRLNSQCDDGNILHSVIKFQHKPRIDFVKEDLICQYNVQFGIASSITYADTL